MYNQQSIPIISIDEAISLEDRDLSNIRLRNEQERGESIDERDSARLAPHSESDQSSNNESNSRRSVLSDIYNQIRRQYENIDTAMFRISLFIAILNRLGAGIDSDIHYSIYRQLFDMQ